jgi:hypothetical protein
MRICLLFMLADCSILKKNCPRSNLQHLKFDTVVLICIDYRCAKLGHHVAMMTKLHKVTHNVCESSVLNLLCHPSDVYKFEVPPRFL